jgi:site-specific recombinase XerD
MSDSIIRDIRDYIINERHEYEKKGRVESALFLNEYGSRVSGDYHNKRIKILVAKTENELLIGKEITLHCLRHSIATHLLDGGASFEFVRAFLGHSEFDTVHIYSRRRKNKMIFQ